MIQYEQLTAAYADLLAVDRQYVLVPPRLPSILDPAAPVLQDLEAGQGQAQAAGDHQHLHCITLSRTNQPYKERIHEA